MAITLAQTHREPSEVILQLNDVAWCTKRACNWEGVAGELVISDSLELGCPKCGSTHTASLPAGFKVPCK